MTKGELKQYNGRRAEVMAMLKAHDKGMIVSEPCGQARYDLIFDDGKRLLRVQVKHAGAGASHAQGSVVVNLRKRYPHGTLKYQSHEADVLIVYVPQMDKLLWFDQQWFIGRSTIDLRLEAPRIKNPNCIYAKNFVWE